MNKVIKHSAKELGINKKAISDNALKVVNGLQKAGFQAYLVGGCARDLILGLKPKDFDVATNATPEETKKLFRNARVIGRRFKIVHVRFGYEVIEVATFRANANDRDNVDSNQMTEGEQGQLLRDNVYGTIEEDVVRRDFRANALYYDPVEGVVLDFVGGVEDIEKAQLISIGEPELRFREDPVRMLRVVRFAAKLKFSMEPEALKMIEDEGKLLAHVSPARLFEEVLKLFHGGAAYETYILLRKYGLFKYLFPFTDQGVIADVEGMPERALKNTDKRIAQGKPVIPAFLFACMLWDPVRADAQILMNDGASDSHAWRVAMNDGLRDQNQYVAVPRRLAEIILDIWNIHFRLIKRNPRMVQACLNNRRFRAAYDFLLLRSSLHEVDQEIAEWWTLVQEVDDAEKDEMIVELGHVYKVQRQARHETGEADGNSINYNQSQGNGNSSPSARTNVRNNPRTNRSNAGKPRSNRPKRAGQGKPTGQGKPAGQRRQGSGLHGRRKVNNRGARANSADGANANDSNAAYGNSAGGARPNARSNGAGRGPSGGRRTGGGRGNGGYRGGVRNDTGHVNAQPKDSYGNYQLEGSEDTAQKKVKVRHKRRVLDPKQDPDKNPHF